MMGSDGEHKLQHDLGSKERAARFYRRQMHDHLTEGMQAFIRRQEMVFIATADANGHCDSSPRFGKPGFVVVMDTKSIAYPEFRGNGVFASLGNILENPHIGLAFVDFLHTTVGLHVNGKACLCSPNEIPDSLSSVSRMYETEHLGQIIEQWVIVEIEEAYIHCSKHIPRLQKLDKPIDWGTDDFKAKADDFFCESKS